MKQTFLLSCCPQWTWWAKIHVWITQHQLAQPPALGFKQSLCIFCLLQWFSWGIGVGWWFCSPPTKPRASAGDSFDTCNRLGWSGVEDDSSNAQDRPLQQRGKELIMQNTQSAQAETLWLVIPTGDVWLPPNSLNVTLILSLSCPYDVEVMESLYFYPAMRQTADASMRQTTCQWKHGFKALII